MVLTRERNTLDHAIWPATARATPDGDVMVGGVRLSDLAERYGSPVHVMDELDVRQRCRDFRRAFPDAEIAYAGKAFLCRAMARWIAEEGLALDVCSAGELAVARSVRFPAERILMHGNGKTPEDLRAALSYGVSRIVVDCPSEITRLAALADRDGPAQRVLIRVTPGVDGNTHPAVATGGEEQKFGFSLASGAAAEAVRRVLAQPALVLTGLHCHIGSQITGITAYQQAARTMVDLLAAVRDEHGLALPHLDLGGGFAVPYLQGEHGLDPRTLAEPLIAALRSACDSHRLPMPRVTLEPGRAISARAGVTLYRVLGIKHTATGRVFVTVNGGMSDNPRPSLYGARYSIRLVGRHAAPGYRSVTVAGRHCEAGDVLVEDAELPADLRPGDLLASASTGAYHHSMASNYNLVPRPPVVCVRAGESRLLIRRETETDLLLRDVG
ncbi:diaminopimelate decarboxylase [Actinoallomurus purpureus]|uniref:diaminopimelate decarboxylase n=1 Tax=Actinoallomurus purpureus TaxID=478114 RepID=UPI002093E3D2|nr:diaminopimelate decarboxylase [Actinoallomurus purpureus]MCO6009719.1 diaminopimelate decarboxylase [Actinoallomurus purpureus]